jgi:hypothetical protein
MHALLLEDLSKTATPQEAATGRVHPLPYFFNLKLVDFSLWVWDVADMVHKAVV